MISQNFLTALNECFDEDCLKISSMTYPEYDFTDAFKHKMNLLIRQQKKIYYPIIKTTCRRVVSAIIAAVMIGSVTAVAYEPAREAIKEFFIKNFSRYSIVRSEGYKENIHVDEQQIITREYSVDIPKGFVFSKEDSVKTETFIFKTYYEKNNKYKYMMFNQYTKDSFSANIDNEQAQIVEKYDKNGNKILVHNYQDLSVIIIWDNGEYIFELSGTCSESELMKIYYSLK